MKDYGPGPHVAVDGIVNLTFRDENYILVIRRKDDLGQKLALPGGFVDPEDVSLFSACKREVMEETGLNLSGIYFQEKFPRTSKSRDPRSWIISFPFKFYLGEVDKLPTVCGMDDAKSAFWLKESETNKHEWFLDHQDILL